MTLMSGDIDRMCADKNRCDGRPKGRSKRSIEEQIEDCLPKRRTGIFFNQNFFFI